MIYMYLKVCDKMYSNDISNSHILEDHIRADVLLKV